MYTTTYSTGIENILKMFQKVSYTHQNRTTVARKLIQNFVWKLQEPRK